MFIWVYDTVFNLIGTIAMIIFFGLLLAKLFYPA